MSELADQMDGLLGRLDETIAWARSRIEECRRQEAKFSGGLGNKHPPQALVEAWTERRALQAVLRMLGREP